MQQEQGKAERKARTLAQKEAEWQSRQEAAVQAARSEAERLGYRAEIVDAVTDEGDVVSSTLLRRLRRDGERERYLRLLRLPLPSP